MKKQLIHFLSTLCVISLFTLGCNTEDKDQTNNDEMTNSISNEAAHSIEIDTIEHDFEFMPPHQFKLLLF